MNGESRVCYLDNKKKKQLKDKPLGTDSHMPHSVLCHQKITIHGTEIQNIQTT